MQKQCTKCNTVKPHKQYYPDRRNKNGLQSWCRACCANYARSDRGKAGMHKYRHRHSEQVRAANRVYRRTEKGRAVKRKLQAQYRHEIENVQERINIAVRLHKAIKKGEIIKPDICFHCGNTGMIHGHHEDYSKPFDVVWLCSFCHAALHRQKREIA